MNILDIIFGPVASLVEKYVPSAADKEAFQLELEKLKQTTDLTQLAAQTDLSKAQLAVNQAEATTDAFRGGWRPFIGWICGVALAYDFLIQPLLSWASTAYWKVPVPPQLDLGTLIMVVSGMLGLGGMRSAERIQGVIPKGK